MRRGCTEEYEAMRRSRGAITDLVEHPELVRLEGANYGMEQSPVVEQHKVPLLPILSVHELNNSAIISRACPLHSPREQYQAVESCTAGRGPP
jgi:hypothetical protein